MDGWVSLETRQMLTNLHNAGYDEIIVLPQRKFGWCQVIDFSGHWAPLCGFNHKASPTECRNIEWNSYHPPLPIVGEMHLHTFLAHEIVGQHDRPSHQLQRLKAWQVPTSPYIVSVNPTLGDLVDTLVDWASECRHITGLKIIAWKQRCETRHFLFELAFPLHFVKFRIRAIRWELSQKNEYTCTLDGRAYNKKFYWPRTCPCSHGDLLKHSLQSGSVATICLINKTPISVVKCQYNRTDTPQLPAQCVVEDGRVRLPQDMRTVLEICNFFNRAGIRVSRQMCFHQYTHAGTRTVGDWMALRSYDVVEWDDEWETFFNERKCCFDQTALMYASNCFEGLGTLKLGLITHAVTSTPDDNLFKLCSFELCSTPGLQTEDIVRARSCWVHYLAFLKRHNIQALQLEFNVMPIEDNYDNDDGVFFNKKKKKKQRPWSFPLNSSTVKWYHNMCCKPPPSPDLKTM